MNARDNQAEPPVCGQLNRDRLAAQRDRPPIGNRPSSFAFSQRTPGRRQPRVQDPALFTGLREDPTLYKCTRLGSGWIPPVALALCAVLALFAIAVADSLNRAGEAYGTTSAFFWFGLLLIYVPIASRVLMRTTRRGERLALIILLGIALYLVKILASPGGFTINDEYIHLRNTQDILRTQHLFSFNPLLPTAAYYPGLAAITAGLVNLTGLSTFTSGLIVIGVARVLLSACIFLIADMVAGSSRVAAAASLIYAANPMFLFWSSSFSYENLALPLAAFVIWWFGRTRNQPGYLVPVVATISIVAVTVTHHFVGFALAALLGAWWLVERFVQRPAVRHQHSLGLMALVSGSATLIWFSFIARPAVSYLLADNILPALRQTGSLLLGHSAPRDLYASGGYVSPEWEAFTGFAAVGLLVLALPPALYLAWRTAFPEGGTARGWRLRSRATMAVAACIAVAYPLSLVPRLTYDGVAISGRSSEYIFTGLGCTLGLLVEESARWRRGQPRHHIEKNVMAGWRRTATATFIVTVIFVGNITIGTAFYQRLAESSNPRGYPWTVQSDVVTASTWALEHLGTNQRFGANAEDVSALATYGEQDTLAENSVWPIFFADTMNGAVVRIIRSDRVHYLLVNWQMTAGVPPTPGYYFSPQEPNAGDYTQPFPGTALRKFNSSCTRLIYESGEIQIFDLSRIENGSCVPKAAQNPARKPVSP